MLYSISSLFKVTRHVTLLNIFFSLVFFANLGQAKAEITLSSSAKEQIRVVINNFKEEQKSPAVSIAVGRNGSVIWEDAVGFADIENSVAATPKSRFRNASIDKWLTATATMLLVEQGKIDLDKPVQEYCKAYPKKKWVIPVRTLLNHTSGVRHYWDSLEEPEDPIERQERQQKIEEEGNGFLVRYTDVTKAIDPFKDDPLLYEPGSKMMYTSHGYRLLGCVMEGAAKTPYSELMTRLIFEPSGMTETVPDDAWAIIPNRVQGYSLDDDENIRRANFRDISENLAAGGHLSTARDLVRFAGSWNAGKLVNDASKDKMVARGAHVEEAAQEYYGYGVSVITVKTSTGEQVPVFVGHGGGQEGTATALTLSLKTGLAVSIMINQDTVEGRRKLALAIFEIINNDLDLN